jgi:hypothetical protein
VCARKAVSARCISLLATVPQTIETVEKGLREIGVADGW